MIKYSDGSYRQITGYINQHLNIRNTQGLVTSGVIDDELWIILEYFSEIEDTGLTFLKNNGIANLALRKKTFRHFQAYVRQAKNYYYSAKTLSPRSSGLLFYYCFLNLAKAAIVIKEPSIGGKRISHGISYKIENNSKFSEQGVKVLSDGIFPKLYSWYFGKKIKPTTLKIPILLNYCTDINYQCRMAGLYKTKILYSRYVHCVNKNQKKSWSLLAIPEASILLKYPKSTKGIIDNYEKVNVPQQNCRELFNLSALEQSHFIFLQSKEIPWMSDNIPAELEVRSETLKLLSEVFQTYYYDDKRADFVISLPYLPNKQIRMDEPIAIYLIMFYLSSLVRYNPQYLEGLLNKKEVWLIDSFVKSCSTTFLRIMVSRIVGTDYIIDRR